MKTSIQLKRWAVYSLLTLSAHTLLIACGKSKSGKDSNAALATSTACLYGAQTCDNQIYNQYSNFGFLPYPGQVVINNPNSQYRYDIYNNTNNGISFCSCPSGTRPVYNGQIGLGCVSVNMVAGYASQMYYWGNTASSYNYVNFNQVSNISGSGVGGCFNDLAWSCFIDVENSCFQGSFCQKIHDQSRLGICTKTKTN